VAGDFLCLAGYSVMDDQLSVLVAIRACIADLAVQFRHAIGGIALDLPGVEAALRQFIDTRVKAWAPTT
jgi:hypothetical protein